MGAERLTNGTIKLVGKEWHVQAKPHVSLRLKRVFGRLASSQQGVLRMKDTPEVCRDLAWFCERYPMEVTPLDILEKRAQLHRARTEVVQRLLDGLEPARSFELAVPAREYQRVAADIWLQAGGLLLADDVGLGKTCSAIAGLTDPRTRPALVVTLTHLPKQWEAEIKRFAPGLRVHIAKRATPYDLTARPRARVNRDLQPALPSLSNAAYGMPDVIIMNYHKLGGWAETLAGVVKGVIFDEVQELRTGEGTEKYNAAKHITEQADFVVGLSATPIYNYGDEFHAVLSVLRPDAVGTRAEFLTEWATTDGKIREPVAFGQWLRDEGLMVRRTRADVGRELPPITNVPHLIEADESQIEKVAAQASQLARLILQQSVKGFDKLRATEELSAQLRLATGLAKAPYVAEFVRLLVESGERVVLFGWHHAVYQVWRERLEDLGVAFYTGEESATQKEESKARFISGEAKVLVMSLRAGAGLDGLQRVSRTVVFGELDWSPGVHEQCTGRVARDQQTEKVVAYYLIADSGSDPVVSDVLGVKTQQIEGVRNPDEDAAAPLMGSEKDVRKLAEDFLRRRGLALPAELATTRETGT